MQDRDLYGQGMSFPPRVGADGRLVVSSGHENIRESIQVILATAPRERVRLPQFGAGLSSLLFEPNTPATWQLIRDRIERALRLWEPRIIVSSVKVEKDPSSDTGAIAEVEYRLVATNTEDRLQLAIELVGGR